MKRVEDLPGSGGIGAGGGRAGPELVSSDDPRWEQGSPGGAQWTN